VTAPAREILTPATSPVPLQSTGVFVGGLIVPRALNGKQTEPVDHLAEARTYRPRRPRPLINTPVPAVYHPCSDPKSPIALNLARAFGGRCLHGSEELANNDPEGWVLASSKEERVKVFVSSTSRDLSEHRAAAIRSLRRLGHQVTAMEDFTATAAYPLDRVLELVRDADAYVVIVAWRYGFIPDTARAKKLPAVEDGTAARSITEWEYLAAREKPDRPVLAFLLAETAAWPPQDIDGFDPRSPGDASPERVREFRARLMSDHIVSFFSTADQLETLVGAAIATERLSRQVEINRIGPGNPIQGATTTPGSSYAGGILEVIRNSATERVITIDVATVWWSTRLYLLAYLLERFTSVRQILIVQCGEFVGLLPLTQIIRTIAAIHVELRRFEANVRARKPEPDVIREAEAVIDRFKAAFTPSPPAARPQRTSSHPASTQPPNASREHELQITVNSANLRQWFQESLHTNPLSLTRLNPASPLDLVRIFDYPGDFVPVIVGEGEASSEQSRCHVIDKAALSLQLARAYVADLLDETRV
jgi:hypothetical protein